MEMQLFNKLLAMGLGMRLVGVHKWLQTNVHQRGKGAPGIHPNYLNSQWTYLSDDVVKLVVMNRLNCLCPGQLQNSFDCQTSR